ncbi:hypothetical protein OIV83_006170 [Microbotryomycetes sp. JL201]|nr:hypothetical protein OIV83_006170 [Microbotryomycetes sp. JL201]
MPSSTTRFAPNVPQDKRDFILSFYSTTDNRNAIDEVCRPVRFSPGRINADHDCGSVKEWRINSWKGIATRDHTAKQVFTIDQECSQVMIDGTLTYGLENGKSISVDWAAKMVFATGTQQLRMKEYQVWADMSPLVAALKA